MPGPVSDSYDPEWGTSAVAEEIDGALKTVYDKLSAVIERGTPPSQSPKPMYIVDLVRTEEMSGRIEGVLTLREWRLLRFAIERALDSL